MSESEGEEFIARNPFEVFANTEESEHQDEVAHDTPLIIAKPVTKKNPRKKKKSTTKNDDIDYDVFPEQHVDASVPSLDYGPLIDANWLDPSIELKKKFSAKTEMPFRSFDSVARRLFPLNFYSASSGKKFHPFSVDSIGLRVERDADSFFLVEEPWYQALREDLELAIRNHDLGMIYGEVLAEHPNCPDALLCLAQAARIHPSVAGSLSPLDLIQRCLFVLQRIVQDNPNFTFGSSVLPYEFAENRRLHLGLFLYAQLLLKQACWKTARNVALLLVSLSRPDEDPLAARHLLAFTSIQCCAYDPVVCSTGYSACDAYNQALAARLSKKADADELLAKATSEYPSIAKCLSSSIDVGILEHVYVSRMGPLWKQPSVASWLSSKSPSACEALEMSEEQRLALFRHHLLSIGSDGWRGFALPTDIAAMPSFSHDPLPPEAATEPASMLSRLLSRFL